MQQNEGELYYKRLMKFILVSCISMDFKERSSFTYQTKAKFHETVLEKDRNVNIIQVKFSLIQE